MRRRSTGNRDCCACEPLLGPATNPSITTYRPAANKSRSLKPLTRRVLQSWSAGRQLAKRTPDTVAPPAEKRSA